MKKKITMLAGFITPFAVVVLVLTLAGLPENNTQDCNLRFGISFTEKLGKKPMDGRMLLLISTDGSREPRFQISDGPNTQLVFGIDVDGLEPGKSAVIDSSVFGYPLKSIAEIPAGEYWVQGLLHVYETFHRSDGHTVKLP
ncbi:MAG: hypothetical protein KAU47_06415, partial [Candidatus Aminicenantes bacterium]|nr:hypothetical protein [Candidatus Aminicenantes bacterium]